jgi:hypothetical protein
MGLDQIPAEKRGPDRSKPLITGAFGGNTIDFRRFAAEGVTLLGRVLAARDGIVENFVHHPQKTFATVSAITGLMHRNK